MSGFIEIAEGTGEPRQVELLGPTSVGAGPGADVTIPGSALAPRHLTLEPSDGGCLVVTLPEATLPLLVEGMTHEGGLVPWGAELSVGDVRIRLLGERLASARPSPVLLLAPFAIGVAIWAIGTAPDRTEVPTAPAAPELLVELPERCRSEGANTRHLAEREAAAALARQQRYPFDASEGVAAVRLFTHAARCFSAAGQATEATANERRAAALRARVEGDYDTARFRLSRALANQDLDLAISESQLLLSLLDGRSDPYVDWLIMLGRRLRLAQARQEPG